MTRPFPLLLAAVALAMGAALFAQTPNRIRIVPQTSDGLLQDMEESLDGTRLLTHDKGYAPRLWDAKRQILLAVLSGHDDPIFHVGFSANGARILTVSARRLQVWDARRARLLAAFVPTEGETFSIGVLSPDGLNLAFGTVTGSVFYGPATEPPQTARLGKHTARVLCLDFRPDGKALFSGAQDASGREWDLEAKKPGWQVTAHKAPIRWASYSTDGARLLTTGFDNRAVCFDAATGTVLAAYPHTIGPRDVENVMMGAAFVGAKGDEIVTASDKGELVFWKPGTPTPIAKLEGHGAPIRELRRSRNGRYLGTYATNETLKVWDAVAHKETPFVPEEGLPTAADFSPNSDVFWIGYSEGEVRRYDLKTGKATKSTLGDVETLSDFNLGADGRLWLRSAHEEGLFGGGRKTSHLFLNLLGGDRGFPFDMRWDNVSFSPDGSRVAIFRRDQEPGFILVETAAPGRLLYGLNGVDKWAFSPDSSKLAIVKENSQVGVFDAVNGKLLYAYALDVEKDWGSLEGPAFHPSQPWIVTAHHPGHVLRLWDYETGKPVRDLGRVESLVPHMVFTPDGKILLVTGYAPDIVRAYDVEKGGVRWSLNAKDLGLGPDAGSPGPIRLSPDGARALVSFGEVLVVVDIATKKVVFSWGGQSGQSQAQHGSVSTQNAFDADPDFGRIVTAEGRTARLRDVASGTVLREFDHPGLVVKVRLFGEDRLVTLDEVGGLTVWNSDTGARLARLVYMKDGSWLAFDDAGRYDAPDPSAVTGAYFVLEWEGGLEAVSMPQLKGLFYEPGLFAKALGLDKEPMRDVPSLESLRLYPELQVKEAPNKPGVYNVTATDRDEGGIGTYNVSINGKRVLIKRAAGYFQVDTANYASFLLPETSLPAGEGNKLEVTVSNERGDLVGPPVILDLGVPKELQAPEVKLYALCVGVSDYAGNTKDLAAAAGDAQGIAEAVKRLGDRLLPGRLEVTTLDTTADSPEGRPTRARILRWFDEVSTKANAADIVLVFFAGHGMSQLGEARDYFFLTSECDPAAVSAADLGRTTVSGDDLRAALAKIPASKQVVILDTCHSGAAGESLMAADRSVSGDYKRAYEAIKDATGTWLLAGTAGDQLSYESSNVDHGMLTYSLLEAIDKGSADGLRKAPSGDLFLDVERWLTYAADRVDSLKNEVGIKGVQHPELKRSRAGASFDLGVMSPEMRGFLGLKAPKPIVIVGAFQQDEEDPAGLEPVVAAALKDSAAVKAWFDVAKHPNVYRIAGSYSVEGETIKVRLVLQKFDGAANRKTLETIEIAGVSSKLADLAAQIRAAVEQRIKALESPPK
ncbi:MAG: caspase family protein [Fimbriimonadaceae bacterium]|nr:caspase family protein [Fimbriimonadaceae bacterium]